MAEISKERVFPSGAVRSTDCDELRYSLVPPEALRAWARRCSRGEKKYGDFNWLKGIPFSSFIDHIQEHLESFKQGSPGEDDDVDNLSAILWGAGALIHYLTSGAQSPTTGKDYTDLDDRGYKSLNGSTTKNRLP